MGEELHEYPPKRAVDFYPIKAGVLFPLCSSDQIASKSFNLTKCKNPSLCSRNVRWANWHSAKLRVDSNSAAMQPYRGHTPARSNSVDNLTQPIQVFIAVNTRAGQQMPVQMDAHVLHIT
ncbi:hypothetical protein N7507_005546 [Penicillium longicatenatum]|nr:hypothetical protein N7507_005546 [Penicillium longicatenatum]